MFLGVAIYHYADTFGLLASIKEHIVKAVEQNADGREKAKELEEKVKALEAKVRELE